MNMRYILATIALFTTSAVQAESVQAQLDALTQLDEVRTEMQTMRGDIEVLQHEIDQLKQQQRDFYDDINQRLGKLESAKPAAGAAIAPATVAPAAVAPAPAVKPPGAYAGSEGTPHAAPLVPPPTSSVDTSDAIAAVKNAPSDLAAYQAAYKLLQGKQYTEAAAAFDTYLTAYPQGDYVANVDYWLGEVHLIQHNYPAAEQSFSRVVTQYPGHQKSADALLKLGYVYEASGDNQKALTTFQQVQQQFPNTAVAQLANTKASQLQQNI